MQPLWHLGLFGGLSLQRAGGGEIRRFRSLKAAALLAYLALHNGRDCPREVLCALLWPDDDGEAARNRLRVSLASLRKQLEPPGVPFGTVLDVASPGNVRLRADAVTVDVAQFEAARLRGDRTAARALYAGELLPSFYDEWILAERERLAALADELGVAPAAAPAPPSPAPVEAPPVPARLPVYLTRFFGRQEEQEELARLLSDPSCRLITLTGVGGQGKTRLAVEAAGRQRARATWFVALADLWDGGRLGEAIRDALELPRVPGDPLQQAVAYLVAPPRPLLVLDNLEQIVARAAPVVATLLQRVPTLTVLATSRSRLDLPGEREVRLHPLPAPEEAYTDDLASVAALPSVALFLDRAQGVRPDFQLTARNAADLAAICRLLDGIPLGLELAAARVSSLTPAQMRTRLTERWNAFDATGRRVEKADRHRSLRATIEWSVALLPADLQRLFVALSVFRGGATSEAVEAICQVDGALDGLTRLRAVSLLQAEERAGELRFSLLDVLRQWGSEQLGEEASEALRQRHAAWFLELARRRGDLPALSDDPAFFDILEAEHANLRAALGWAQAADPERFGALAVCLASFWERRAYLREGREWLEASLASLPPGPMRTRALLGAGILAGRQGDVAVALAWLEEGLSDALARGDRGAEAALRNGQGVAHWVHGDLGDARERFEESLRLSRDLGDRYAEAAALASLGAVSRDTGDYAGARAYFEETIALAEELDARRPLANTLNNLAALLYILGEDGAEPLWERSLVIKRELGDTHGVAVTLSNLAVLCCRRGDWAQGRRMTEEVCGMLRAMGDRRALAIALNRLGQIAVAQEKRSEGAVHLAEALALRLAMGNPKDIATSLIALSDLMLESGQAARAAQLLGAAHARLHDARVALPPDEGREYVQHQDAVRAALSASAYARAHAHGATLDEEQIRALVAAAT